VRKIIILSACSVFFLFSSSSCNDSKKLQNEDQNKGKSEQIQPPSGLSVMFYNVENLFDTANDPLKDDDEFTPDGKLQWTAERYAKKLQDLAKVISSIDDELPSMVGLCEVENRFVVEELFSKTNLAAGNYAVLHREGPDGRGIDCALAYRKDHIRFDTEKYYNVKLPAGSRPDTRLLLYARGIQGKDTLHVFVNHWPSRSGGQLETEPNRLTLALLLREKADSILMSNQDARIIMMGDFNDYPNDKSIREVLQASGKGDGHFYNFMDEFQKKGEGTYNYKGEWGCLDQFIVSNRIVQSDKGFRAQAGSAKIFSADWLLFVGADGKAAPSRTYGKDYYGGYSDHLPIFLELTK
jgi:predicted extracellular nuclease